MKCLQCGEPIALGSSGCARCGTLSPTVAQPPRSRRRLALFAFGTLAVLGAAFVGLPKIGVRIPGVSSLAAKGPGSGQAAWSDAQTGSNLASLISKRLDSGQSSLEIDEKSVDSILATTSEAGAPSLSAGAEAQTPTLGVSGSATQPTLQAPAEHAAMPKDVFDWLEHLRKCEARRMSIAQSQLASAMSLFGNLQKGQSQDALSEDDASQQTGERTGRVSTDAGQMRQAWVGLVQEFDRVPAPASCADLKATYDTVLNKTGSMILDIINAIANASRDPQGALAVLTKMQGTSDSQIDKPAKDADAELGAICRKYQTDKWFDVKADVGAGLMSKLGY